MHILIIDEVGATVNKKTIYSDFIQTGEDVKLSIITSQGGLTQTDKEKVENYIELNPAPSCNGQVEIWALELHCRDSIDFVYTKQEDLLLRASTLRKLLGLNNGLTPEGAIAFRDKADMKKRALSHGVQCPPFARILSPACILEFVENNGLPVVIKPCYGSASTGVQVLKTKQDVDNYIAKKMFGRVEADIQTTGNLETPGSLMIEKFVKGTMYHVNGYAKDGKIIQPFLWPFSYLSTNLEFTEGKSYGNCSIPPQDERYTHLMEAAQQVLDALPCPPHTMFHLELFETNGEYLLCEIAARRPGGSISLLIDSLTGKTWHALEFRLSCGLPVNHLENNGQVKAVADLLVPMKRGMLLDLPSNLDLALPQDLQVTYIPFAKVGTTYSGFSINHLNTACRLVVQSSKTWDGITVDMANALTRMEEWFQTKRKVITPSEMELLPPLATERLKIVG